MQIVDSLINLIAGVGTSKSKLTNDKFIRREVSDSELWDMYRCDWLARKIVDVPVSDMLREWREWQADPKLIEAIENAEERWQVQETLSQASLYARLFGGSAIVIGADTANPEKPLDPLAISQGSLKYLTAFAQQDLPAGDIDRDPYSPNFGKPAFYQLSTQTSSVNIHWSRVLRFVGNNRLDTNASRSVSKWGDSILAAAYDAIHHAALSQQGIADLIHEAKIDIIKVPNLGQMLSTQEGTEQMVKRFTGANMLKSNTNSLVLDAQEEWDRKQTSFSALPDLIDRYLSIVAGAADIPATRLLSQSPGGLNATGNSDIRNYYDSLAGKRRDTIEPNLKILDRILWLDAVGRIPKDAYYEWCPMWQMTEAEKATVAYQKAQATNIYATLNIMPEEALRAGVQNQLIEDGTYPGLEAAIADLLAKGIDPLEPAAEEDPANDNPKTNSPVSNDRYQLTRMS